MASGPDVRGGLDAEVDAIRVASVTKTVTAVVVLRLADRGPPPLDGPIGDVLPDLAGGWPNVTGHEDVGRLPWRMLLGHTSGLPTTSAHPLGMDSTWLEHHEAPRTASRRRRRHRARLGRRRPLVHGRGPRAPDVPLAGHTGAWGAFAYAAPDHGWIVTGTVNRFGVDRRPVLRAVVDALLA